MALLIYVDDIILASNNFHDIFIVKSYLHDAFIIIDLSELKYFLGIEVAKSTKGITLCQHKYVMDILIESDFSGCKPTGFLI